MPSAYSPDAVVVIVFLSVAAAVLLVACVIGCVIRHERQDELESIDPVENFERLDYKMNRNNSERKFKLLRSIKTTFNPSTTTSTIAIKSEHKKKKKKKKKVLCVD
eukprot:Trichotokara_eunicae@DN8828_c0_g1_i1.p1